MPVAIPECTNFIDCSGNPLTPVVAVDLASYDKFAGKGNNPSLGPSISGSVISYDFSSWTNWPESWSWDCGVWIAGGNDVFIGQGGQGSCANVWASLNDVLATMNALDPNGLSWSISGTTISATAPAIPATGITYQVATCADIPTFVDCNGDPLQPMAGGTVSDSIVSTGSYVGAGNTSTKLADVATGVHDFKVTFANVADAISLHSALVALDGDPYSWAHETITPPGLILDWPHGSFTNISLVGSEVFYRIDLNLTAITPTPPAPYSASPAGSDFTLNKSLLITAYQSLPLNVAIAGSDFTFDLHTQVLSGAAGTVYQVATCADIPTFVDCNGDPLTPAGSTSIYSVLSKHDPAAYASFGAPWSLAVYVADITAGTHGGWFVYEWCFAPGTAPANDPNGHTIYNTPYTSNPDLAANDVLAPTGNASPTCASATGLVYGVATCDDIVDLQTQIDALAASEKYVVSGVIQNPNTASATLVLTLNDASTISIDVSSLEDTFTAAQILALFPNGANVQVTAAGTSVRFLGQDGQWHTLTIPATTNALTSSVNTMTSTVNGAVATAPIVNSNVLSLAGSTLTSTVNGVTTSVSLASFVPATTNTLAINGTGQIVSTVNGVVASLTYLSTVAPPADGVGDTRAGSAGTALQAARRDHVHPIEFIQAPPVFGDLLLSGNLSSAGAISMAATYTTEETITYRGQKPVTANTGTWSIATPPALAGYALTSFEGSPYSPSGMDNAAAGPAGGGSRDFNWMYTTYYDNVRRNNLAHNLSFKAEYRLN